MAKVYSKNSNVKKNKSKKITAKQKKLIAIIFSGVIFLSIVCTALFGFKLYAYGRDISIIYDTKGGKIDSQFQTVEFYKDYTLKTPTYPGGELEFAYWSTDGTEKGKVENTGKWLVTTERRVVLYAVWVDEYTKNY